jgi:hypothetical protein
MTSFRVDRAQMDTAAPLSLEVMADRYGPPREEPLLRRSGEAPDLRPTASAVSFNRDISDVLSSCIMCWQCAAAPYTGG